MTLHIIILAAGKGTRMCANTPKVLHQLGGKPLLEHVIRAAQSLKPKKIHVIYGSYGTSMQKHFSHYEINWVEQLQQLGTGHAVMQALPLIEKTAKILILYGDVPLITSATLEQLVENLPPAGLSLLTAEFADPRGMGRIVRDSCGMIQEIVEHQDASPLQQAIQEINSGILITTAKILQAYLSRLHPHNAQGEYYLTDIIAMLYRDKIPINCLLSINPEEVIGINDQKQLAKLERQYQKNLAENLMLQGLTLMDPARFDLRGELVIGRDVSIDVNVVIEGKVTIDSNTTIAPNNFLKDSNIGKNVTIKSNCVIEHAVINDGCVVGPFARIRPDSYLDAGVHVGNFVEIKNSKLGKNSKANHLSYIGDATIGNNVNLGAGTITCNYDGVNKNHTIIEDEVFVGSNTALVAPVKLGKGAVIGAGSVITMNAPAEKLTLARAKQTTIEGWQQQKKREHH